MTTDYEQTTDDKGMVHIKTNEKLACPICGGEVRHRDVKKRKVILPENKGSNAKTILKVERVYCNHCQRLHSVLPDMVVPYKQHCAETIEKIAEGDDDPPL